MNRAKHYIRWRAVGLEIQVRAKLSALGLLRSYRYFEVGLAMDDLHGLTPELSRAMLLAFRFVQHPLPGEIRTRLRGPGQSSQRQPEHPGNRECALHG
jgi:hypothetical protein